MNEFLGQLLALLTAACWASNSVSWKYLGERSNSSFIANARMWVALPLILVVTLAFDHRLPLSSSPTTYIVLLISGCIGYFITDMLMFRAYILLGARESLVILTLSPVFTAAMSWALFNERLRLIQMLGILLTLSGIVLMILSEKRAKTDERKNIKKGVLFALLGSFFQALSYILAKYALDDITPIASNLIRNVGGFLSFLIYTLFFERTFFRDLGFFKRKKYLVIMIAAVIAGPVVGMSSQMVAFTLAPAGIVSAIAQVSPVLLLPIDRFVFKKHITLLSLLGTLISISGVIILFL